MPKGHYVRKPETIQKLKEQMKIIGKGRKGKKYASTKQHEQPMEEMIPKPAEEIKVGENKLNNNQNMAEEEKKDTETTDTPKTPEEPETPTETPEEPKESDVPEPTPSPTTPNRPLTGPEIRKQQEESGKR